MKSKVFKSKKFRISLGIIVVLLIALRVALPEIIKKQLNDFLANFSQVYSFHVADVDLSILRGAYRLEGVEGRLKKVDQDFLKIEYVDISVSWRDLFRGHLRTDIFGQGVEFKGTQAFLQAIKDQSAASKKDAQELGNKVFPLRISRIDLRNSKATIEDVNGIPEELRLRLTNIDGRVSNVTATEREPNSFINLRAVLQDSATAVIVGEVDQKQAPAEYLFSLEMKGLDLISLNPFLQRRVPLTFKKGQGDVYAEIKGENGNLYGYVKPFVKDVEMMGDEGDFKGIKHWSLEVATAFSNFILKSPRDKSVATKFNFSYEADQFNWNLGEVLGKAFSHGFGEGLQPGLDDQFHMKTKAPIEKKSKENPKQP
ncbi:hypothetical protein AZI86_12465 [Bdellovibrio bacteriovorus]|uniref:DUF748 domain-containing protein n=1 Tax=Bdellovibrio bacteriovorus TaxID=959 RepID=A0A150WIP3_BDEBC|nr:DUF748 domain-containing protein [Bdellovibrio bacteriovorus]KYG63638.1 hypothetical protein AZI86_12465 [Bdellovibrio bacteriovorus]